MLRTWMIVLIAGLMLAGCGKKQEVPQSKEVTLILGAYTVPKEAYQKEIIPAFQKYWFEKTGQQVKFEESYIASGAQSRAIEAGFEADIAALSLEDDINRLQDANLVTHDWKKLPYNGFVTQAVVVIAFRRGNPMNIRNWEDLTRPGIGVLYPSPKTSGGAMWDINAIYGAGLKISEMNFGKPDKQAARNLLKAIQKNVKVMDKSGRASVTTFENGIGDALVTYENEIILRLFEGRDVDYIIPDATILIENPVALVDRYVDKHNTRPVAEAFVKFVFEKESQRAFAKYGFRPVDPEVAAQFSAQYPVPKHLFDINYLGGWKQVIPEIFGEHGVWTQITEELGNER